MKVTYIVREILLPLVALGFDAGIFGLRFPAGVHRRFLRRLARVQREREGEFRALRLIGPRTFISARIWACMWAHTWPQCGPDDGPLGHLWRTLNQVSNNMPTRAPLVDYVGAAGLGGRLKFPATHGRGIRVRNGCCEARSGLFLGKHFNFWVTR